MENDLLSVLSKGGNKFSKGQRIIAKYILSNYDKAAFMTAGRLGKIVGVSESTVVRFAAESIIEAKNIYIVGMRTSTSLSSFLGLYLNLLRSNVSVIHDTAASEVFEQIIRIGEGDLFIAISFPRYSSHTVDAMEFAKKMGAMTAAITDGPASPLNGIADVCLHAKSDMVSFLDSLVAPMSLINAIIIAVGIKNKENLSKTFERLETVWSENKVYEQTQHGGTT